MRDLRAYENGELGKDGYPPEWHETVEQANGVERLRTLLTEGCREELGAEANYNKCWEPAEFILWGKLFPPEALGPRCYDHAAKHAGHAALGDKDYAILRLGAALKALDAVAGGRSPDAP